MTSTYDQESGLVYRETVLKVPRPHKSGLPGPAWLHTCRGSKDFRKAGNALIKGTNSLEDTTFSWILCHLDDLDARALRGLPERLVERLWERIKRW